MQMGKKGKTGGNTSSVEYSPARVERMNRARERQEKRWARMAGPVTIRKIEEEPEEED
jgi:hypothetical protein